MKKMKYMVMILCLAGFSSYSCQTNSNSMNDLDAEKPYFSLNEYFDQEIKRLTQQNDSIFKIVSINGNEEEKRVHIADWNTELAAFKEADINKPSWKSSYQIVRTDSTLTYQSMEASLKTKKIEILWGVDEQIQSLTIYNELENWIYKSKETLTYVPDEKYEIIKEQAIKIVGDQRYTIKGQFTTAP